MSRVGSSGSRPRGPEKTPTVWWSDEADAWAVDTPYNEDFVAQLKARSSRTSKWNSDRKVWYVRDPFIDSIKELLKETFGDYLFMPRVAAASPSIGVAGSVHRDFVLCFTREELTGAYRKAQMRLHPDKGGDAAESARLNQLWDQVQKELK